jgi:hypothetical protein
MTSTKNPITITRALVELKTLDDRITKATTSIDFVRVYYPDRGVEAENFKALCQSNMQSITDMINYRASLKGAIVRSNAETKVTVAGKEYTVAEAIERKNSIRYEKAFIDSLSIQLREAIHKRDAHNAASEARLERMLTAELSKDKRTDLQIVKDLTEGYRKANMATLNDPLGLETLIKSMQDSIAGFEAEVDVCLSESNSRTMVSVH